MSTIVYPFQDNLYINLTNRCTMACTYCIKYKWEHKFRGHDLRLEKAQEPSAAEVIRAIGDPTKYHEIIFCGYGEPLIRLDVLKKVAAWVKEKGGRVRINTAGNANLYHGRNIVPELKGLVDTISISLNAHTGKGYRELNRPRFGEKAFRGTLDFIRQCRKHLPDVTVTAVEMPGVDVEKVRAIAERLDVKFRLRPYLDEYENS